MFRECVILDQNKLIFFEYISRFYYIFNLTYKI